VVLGLQASVSRNWNALKPLGAEKQFFKVQHRDDRMLVITYMFYTGNFIIWNPCSPTHHPKAELFLQNIKVPPAFQEQGNTHHPNQESTHQKNKKTPMPQK
jgi:hypothetical protein